MKKKTKIQLLALSAFPVLFLMFQNFQSQPAAPEKFKIIWHVGTAIEPLADATGDKLNVIENIKSHVDGYYFLVLNNGSLLTYWKGRPIECLINYKSLKWKNQDGSQEVKLSLNGKLYGEDAKDKCAFELEAYQTKLWEQSGKKLRFKEFQVALHENALKRAFKNLNLQGEKAAGKTIMAEMLIRGGQNGEFVYNSTADMINLLKPDGVLSTPKSYSFLRDNGIAPDRMMTYQEPRPQSENGSLVRVPLEKNGPTDYEPGVQGCTFCLPWNLRVLDMVADAFERENLRAPKMAINIRTWSPAFEEKMHAFLKTKPKHFGGINVEGSAKKMHKASYEKSLDGVAYMLKNTNRPVSFLIPGSLNLDETDTEDMRDEKRLEQFLEYIRDVNSYLNEKLALPKGQNAICNSRLSLIVGSYGSPMHMETLPLFRHDGAGQRTHRAGTVGSEILVLSNLRDRLCK